MVAINNKPRKYSAELKRAAIEMKETGCSFGEICRKLNIGSRYTVRDWWRSYRDGNMVYNNSMNKNDELFAPKKKKTNFKKLTHEQLIEIAKNAEQLEFERDCAVVQLDIVKKFQGSTQSNGENFSKEILRKTVDVLSPKYFVKRICTKIGLPKSTYYEAPIIIEEKWLQYEKDVADWCLKYEYSKGKIGRRGVIKDMKKENFPIHERHLRMILNKLGWRMIQANTMKPYRSYKNDGVPPVPNYLFGKVFDEKEGKEVYKHFFAPENYWEILGTDVTEFHINGHKIYLSMIIDFKDSRPVTWTISQNPNTELIVGSVEKLLEIRPKDSRFILHMDQGSVNRSYAMKNICSDNHILQSMSRKGKSGDNAPTEGFFGRLKQMWFDKKSFAKMSYADFVKELDLFLHWYQQRFENPKNTMEMVA